MMCAASSKYRLTAWNEVSPSRAMTRCCQLDVVVVGAAGKSNASPGIVVVYSVAVNDPEDASTSKITPSGETHSVPDEPPDALSCPGLTVAIRHRAATPAIVRSS